MANINNSELTQEIREGAKIQIGRDSIPTQLGNIVVPVMEVNPKVLQLTNYVRNTNSATSLSGNTAFALPSDKDFYLTGLSLNYMSDAAADNTSHTVIVVPDGDGAQRQIINIRKLSLTALSGTHVLQLPRPIKLKRGSSVYWSNSFTVGNSTLGITLFGFTVETGNA